MFFAISSLALLYGLFVLFGCENCSVFQNVPCFTTEALLADANVNLSLTDQKGNTALHLACSNVNICLIARNI